jgi:hypothetical protein
VKRHIGLAIAFLLAAGLVSAGAAAQQKTVGGMVINLGVMPAAQAMRVDGHRDLHPEKFPTGSQHVLVALADAKTGGRIGDAQVLVEVKDPKGRTFKKALLRTHSAGMPDYSELFEFGWSGKYSVRVSVTPKPGVKPIEATFNLSHSI